jgi:hypothetical protein
VLAVAAERRADKVRAAVITVDAPISPGVAKEILRQAKTLLAASGYDEIICDVSGRPDLSLVDVLARLALLTQRSQACLRIRAVGASSEGLADLLALTGLECVNQLEARRKTKASE